MDWLRRNWPDLLIGIALVAVIAGIIATLITGGSFFPVGQNTQTSTPPAQSSTAQSPAQPATSSPSTSSTSSTASPSTNAASGSSTSSSSTSSPAASSGSSSGGATSASSGSSSAAAPSNGGVSVLPPGGSGSGSSSASAGTPASAPSSASSGAGSSSTASSTAGTTTTASAAPPSTPAASASVATSSGPGAAAPYRISVGAFSHPDYAKRREQVFTKAGYPAFLASQGDLTIVLVGPYRTLKEADAVASRIKSGGFGVDPVVYQFKGSSDSAPPPASPSAGGNAASSAASGASAATSSSSSASAGQRYLQVGAYGTAASAKPQRDRMTSMGYQVTEKTEGGLVKLLIGPFGPAKLQQVQGQLKAAGIDSFPR